MPETFVHIGFPKTGTSTLQKFLFADRPDLCYFGQSTVFKDQKAQTILKAFLLNPEHRSPTLDDEAKTVLDAEDKKIIISDEALTFGQFMLRGPEWDLKTDHAEIAQNIKTIAPGAKIIMVLRNQVDWLRSFHRQGLKTGKYAHTNFDDWLAHDIGMDREDMFKLLEYTPVVKIYTQIFSKENVQIYLYEDFKDNYAELATNIAAFMNINIKDIGDSMSGKATNVTKQSYSGMPTPLKKLSQTQTAQKLISVMPKNIQKALRKTVKKDITFEELSKQNILDIKAHYKEDNALLFDLLGIKDPPPGYF